ncbi:hypothetical protein GARC_3644 [Paraglaciecola arctica BSs20135]|uniref:Uncharacterized protein n=1 Tax=Paraglaciecola arctica BSs20135 TaxID=493475 RepID=K6YV52_9ALTE|nr:hypothetical protein GARC_3644 [Paraglaciecola arctica BSs20135]
MVNRAKYKKQPDIKMTIVLVFCIKEQKQKVTRYIRFNTAIAEYQLNTNH